MKISLNGYVVDSDDLWLYDWAGYRAFSPETVRQALKDNPSNEPLVLEINSYGGSVFAADEIYTLLRGADVETRAEIQSIAASAASYLCMGCKEVLISPVAQLMIHPPAISTSGDKAEHKQSIKLLDATMESILNAYTAKSNGKRTRDELTRMMQSTTWLTAEEALDAGLVDGIMFAEEYTPDLKTVVNAASGSLRAMASCSPMPMPDQLRAAYHSQDQSHNPEGAPPSKNNTLGWQAKARLKIEQNRFGGTKCVEN